MSLNSINTNIAAYSAQSNIGSAANSASASIARLSSGNRIVRAADDVASLSVGTSLRTGVTTLKQALANTTQGSSLLQVADGALGQVSEILQRQKAISVQANSGTLSDTERAYLNQEFQALSSQIDQIAASTSFSSVKLLNGSLEGSTAVSTKTQDSSATADVANVIVHDVTNAIATGNKVSINGVVVEFTNATQGTSAAAGKVQVSTNATVADQVAETLANLAAFLNQSTDARLANYNFSASAGNLVAGWSGGALATTAATTTVTTALVSGTTAHWTTTGNITITGANSTDGLGVNRTRALGTFSGSLLNNGGPATAAGGGPLNLGTVEDNAAFVGKLGGESIGEFKGSFTATDNIAFSIKVGDITYISAATDVTAATTTAVTFTGYDANNVAKGGTFTLNLAGGATADNVVNGQSAADDYVSQLNDSFKNVTFVQNRDIKSFQTSEIVSVGGVQVANLDGLKVDLRSADFGDVKIESFKITAPAAGQTDAVFEATINGEKYVSVAGQGSSFGQNSPIRLQSQSNAANVLTIVTSNTLNAGSTTSTFDVSNQSNADAIATALKTAFGLDDTKSALNFQIGAASTDTIGVKLSDISSGKLFNGATLDVSTINGAQAASNAVDKAIGYINSVRADVGALQSRLDFTAANLESSIQNQDAARGTLLDTDVAAESTDYATAQVQLQAGIAVLAQANLLPQNLLKLIG